MVVLVCCLPNNVRFYSGFIKPGAFYRELEEFIARRFAECVT